MKTVLIVAAGLCGIVALEAIRRALSMTSGNPIQDAFIDVAVVAVLIYAVFAVRDIRAKN